MKKTIFFILLLSLNILKADFFNSTSNYCSSIKTEGEQPTVASILNNYFIAVAGSRENLEGMKSLVSEADIFFSQLPEGGSVITKYQVPNKFISTISILGQKIIKGFNGTNYFSNVSTGNTTTEQEELKNNKGIFSELYYTDNEATLNGKEKLGDKEVYKITIKEKNKNEKIIIYFDIDTGFKVREEISTDKETITKTYLDYKDFGGFKLPTKITTSAPSQIMTQLIKKYTINPILTEADFKL